MAIYKPTQPDYIGGCKLPDGWTQKRVENLHLIEGQVEYVKADDILKMKLTKKEKTDVRTKYDFLVHEHAEDIQKAKADYKAKLTPEQLAAYESYEKADAISMDWTFSPFGDDIVVSIREMVVDFDKWSNTYFREPFDTNSKSNRCILAKDNDGYYLYTFGRGKLRIAHGDWRDGLQMDFSSKTGKNEVRKASFINAGLYLKTMLDERGDTLKFNDFSGRMEYSGNNLTDAVVNSFKPDLELFAGFVIQDTYLMPAIQNNALAD